MSKGQIFGVPTYDAIFKWVLSSASVRSSFFQTFVPGLVVNSSERLDDHMNPVKELEMLRDKIHSSETTNLVDLLQKDKSNLEVSLRKAYHQDATEFVHDLLDYFPDIQNSFPKVLFDGKMDFVCKLDTGDFAIVEMQIVPHNQWDQRALAYVAGCYANQLRRKDEGVEPWKNIRKVIGINILGGGKDNVNHWNKTRKEYVRHYRLQEQINKQKTPRFLEGLEIFQYCLFNSPKKLQNRELSDWLLFFREAHHMKEEDVKKKIKTPAVLEAFERAKITTLPKEVQQSYEQENAQYEKISEYVEMTKNEASAKAEAKATKAETKAAEAETKAAEAETKAAEAETKAAEAEAKAAEAKAKVAEAKAKVAEAEAKAAEAGVKAKLEAEARLKAEAKAKLEAEARNEAEAKARKIQAKMEELLQGLLAEGMSTATIQKVLGLSEEEIEHLTAKITLGEWEKN